MAARVSRHTKYPEFSGMKELVWQALNQYGRTIPKIQSDEDRTLTIGSKSAHLKGDPIWHTKSEIDEFVAKGLGLKFEDYEYRSGNALYKQIANEIRALRQKGILQDLRKTMSGTKGVGVWYLDKTRLEDYALGHLKKELKKGNFYASGETCEVFVRHKQGAFRAELFSQYRKCVLCRFGISDYLIGAHIVPYSVMRDKEPENAMNPANGLLLCRFCDTAFEKGSITVAKDYGIEISEYLQEQRGRVVQSWLGSIPSEMRIASDVKYRPDPKYLAWKRRLLRNQSA